MKTIELTDIYRLKNIVRYNSRTKITNENVAEHSFFATVIALQICDEHNLSDEDKLKVLIKILLHDLPEIELNDITYDVKEKLNLRPLLKMYEDEYFERNYSKYCELMNKPQNIVDDVVELADALSVLQYTTNELLLGNKAEEMQNIYYETVDRCNELEKKLNKNLKKGGN